VTEALFLFCSPSQSHSHSSLFLEFEDKRVQYDELIKMRETDGSKFLGQVGEILTRLNHSFPTATSFSRPIARTLSPRGTFLRYNNHPLFHTTHYSCLC
jgi:hypothetical protein